MVALLTCLLSSAWAGKRPPAHFVATFVQTRTLPGFEEPLTSHGLLRVSKAEGFYWEILKPYHYVFAMNDGKAYEELPDGTRRVLKADETPWLRMVQRIFVNALSGNRGRIERWFEVKVEPLEHGRHVTLLPRAEAMAQVIERIEVTENIAGQPRYLEIEQASGARMVIRFTPADNDAEPP
ncbi:MAG: outer membrane lipoprotein carrier protein LolA [Nitrococcus sp.]|nr:outer membrane lipoprotein carrier protein LolA [Nitrococcus sp.]